MQERTREMLRAATFEAAFVVFGVVLAFAANEWREARVHRRQASAALAEIGAELRSNRSAVQEALGYHSSLLDSLRLHRGDSTWTPSIRRFQRGFIAPAQLDRTAWTSASETGALSYIPFRDVLRISRMYAQQAVYDEQVRNTGQIIHGELYRGGTGAIVRNHRNLMSVIQTFAYREQQLATRLDSTLAVVGVARPQGAR